MARVVVIALLLAAGCAHVEETRQSRKAPGLALVTGSRIPRPVNPVSGEVDGFDHVRVYSRERLAVAGRGSSLAAALRALDPSF